MFGGPLCRAVHSLQAAGIFLTFCLSDLHIPAAVMFMEGMAHL